MRRLIMAAKAAAIHLTISGVVASVAACLVFGLWFPFPYFELGGGLHLFWILVAVDVVLGPLLTLLLFNPVKPRREMAMDLTLIGFIQMAALAYGLYSIGLARPVVLAFEVDRFVAVSAADVDTDTLSEAPDTLRSLSWTGPVLVGTRSAKNNDEQMLSISLSLQGLEPSARPGWWQSYSDSRPDAMLRMKPLRDLQKAKLKEWKKIERVIEKTKLPVEKIFYLPLVSRKTMDEWVVLLNQDANIVGFAPVGGFEASLQQISE